MEFERRAPISTNLSIAPLIDVVFLLLIFFMLTSTMVVEESIELNLPAATTGSASDSEVITISVSSRNEFYVRGDLLSLSDLEDRLRTELSSDSEKQIIVRSDSEVPIQTFVTIMDTVRKVGGKNVSLATSDK